MRPPFLLTSLLAGAALAFGAAPAHAQVTINIGTPPPPPPVVVVREARPVKHHKHHHHCRHYRPQPVMLVPAQPVYYVPAGGHPGRGRGHGHGHGRH